MQKSKTLSEKFVFIDNSTLIKTAISAGYELVKSYRDGFTLKDASYNLNGNVPTIKVFNKNDGTAALRLQLGVFRLACANGLMVSDDQTIKKVRHIGKKPVEFITDFIKELVALRDHYNSLTISIEKMSNKVMDEHGMRRFATGMIQYRGIKTKTNEELNATIDFLLTVRRDEDRDNTVYNVFNRIQENLTRKIDGDKFKLRLLRSESSLDRLNQKLWGEAINIAA